MCNWGGGLAWRTKCTVDEHCSSGASRGSAGGQEPVSFIRAFDVGANRWGYLVVDLVHQLVYVRGGIRRLARGNEKAI